MNMADAHAVVANALARGVAPRKALTVSEWADTYRWLSSKSSPKPGRWRTNNNPPLREPMDCMSPRSPVKEVVLKFPIQFGKSEFETNVLGCLMTQAPGPTMVCLPGEVSMNKWINQKLNPLIEETPAVREVLTSTHSRNRANQKDFKDFIGGQLYIEHAGSSARLKSTTVRYLLVDEYTEFAANLKGDDPAAMLDGRTSAFPYRYKRAYVSTPGIVGMCRTTEKWDKSDQRLYHIECPHCHHPQPLEWSGLQYRRAPDGSVTAAWYVCRDCGVMIEETHKTVMLRDVAAGGTARWVPTYPDRTVRGYHLNCLYYQIGMGPDWRDCAQMWLDAQNDPAKLKTFINDRLAEAWEDRSLRAVKSNILADRAEPGWALRHAPWGVLWVTSGVDTQDDRLEVQIVGWGRGMRAWVLDYAVLWGDPQHDDVWVQLTDLLNRPIEHASGLSLPVSAVAIDGRGHRTQAVKDYCRKALVRRCMPIFGAKSANATPVSKPKLEDVDHRGKTDVAGSIRTYQVGTVAIKHTFFRRLASDADTDSDSLHKRWVRFPEGLPPSWYAGLVSEAFDPVKGRYVKKGAARNEPLDTWVYAYAAAHHPELRLHTRTRADWDADEARLLAAAGLSVTPDEAQQDQPPAAPTATPPAQPNPTAPRRAPRRRTARSTYLDQ